MKLPQQKKGPSKVFLICLASVLIVFGAVYSFWIVPLQSKVATEAAELASRPIEKPPVKIRIGDMKFNTLVEDSTKPSSIWVLANKQHPLADPNYAPKKLISMPVPVRPDVTDEEKTISSVIEKPLTKMFADAEAQGFKMIVGSGYRSGATQKMYFDSYVRTHGETEARKFSALPGQSEHQTGLAVDISTNTKDCYLSECFILEPEGKWLAANAHTYGFILRYPENKTDITGYNYEPWHYRYVGTELATALHESGLTLEEVQPQITRAMQALKNRGDI